MLLYLAQLTEILKISPSFKASGFICNIDSTFTVLKIDKKK